MRNEGALLECSTKFSGSSELTCNVGSEQATTTKQACRAMQMQVVARHSKKAKERHVHGGLSLGIAGVAMAILPALLQRIAWLALVLITIGMSGIWAVHVSPNADFPFSHGVAGIVVHSITFCGKEQADWSIELYLRTCWRWVK